MRSSREDRGNRSGKWFEGAATWSFAVESFAGGDN